MGRTTLSRFDCGCSGAAVLTVVELLEGAGLPPLCIAVPEEEDAGRVVGEVLAEAVKVLLSCCTMQLPLLWVPEVCRAATSVGPDWQLQTYHSTIVYSLQPAVYSLAINRVFCCCDWLSPGLFTDPAQLGMTNKLGVVTGTEREESF